jgi:protein LTV1
LAVDETAPQHVLVPISKRKEPEPSSSKSSDIQLPPEKRKKEQEQFGIFFDDDYNYLQHLREPGKNEIHWIEVPHKSKDKDPKEKPKIQLPSSVFESEYQEKEGMLNKAAKQGLRLDWDPEVVAALDEDFNFEDPANELEDNFMELAMGGEGCDDDDDEWLDEEEEIDSDGADFSDEEGDELGPLPGSKFPNFDDEETKSRFTEYSMSSSVIRRNEQLTLLDDRFEKFFENYDEPEVGALDCEEIEGHIDIDDRVFNNLSKDFQKTQPLQYEKDWDICRMVKIQQEQEEKPEEMVMLEVTEEEGGKKKWDCESILSTYSNLYNHPKLIEVPSKKKNLLIQINPKTGMPKNVLGGDGKLTEKTLAKLNDGVSSNGGPKSLCAESVLSTLSVLSIRPKDETPEEKKERKKLLKEYRNERRIEKKANKLAFNEERLRQHAITMNNKNNLAGNKII